MRKEEVLDAVFQPWRISVITTACRLGLFTRLDGRAMNAEELAREARCVPRMLEALLDACVGIGLLLREGRAYRNSELAGAYLVEGRPLYIGHILEVQARAAPVWSRLPDLVRTGEAPDVPGDVDEQDPLFTLAMNDLGGLGEAEALADGVDLSGCASLVDLGCGSGIYAVAFCRRYPGLVATLVDRETVLATTRRLVEASGLGGRIHARAGDMTARLGHDEADAILLSDSLYQDVETATDILRSVYAALHAGGRVIIRGYYPEPGAGGSAFGAIFRLNLLLSDPRRTPPTAADIADALAKAGFRDVRRFLLTERSTCFLGFKPRPRSAC